MPFVPEVQPLMVVVSNLSSASPSASDRLDASLLRFLNGDMDAAGLADAVAEGLAQMPDIFSSVLPSSSSSQACCLSSSSTFSPPPAQSSGGGGGSSIPSTPRCISNVKGAVAAAVAAAVPKGSHAQKAQASTVLAALLQLCRVPLQTKPVNTTAATAAPSKREYTNNDNTTVSSDEAVDSNGGVRQITSTSTAADSMQPLLQLFDAYPLLLPWLEAVGNTPSFWGMHVMPTSVTFSSLEIRCCFYHYRNRHCHNDYGLANTSTAAAASTTTTATSVTREGLACSDGDEHKMEKDDGEGGRMAPSLALALIEEALCLILNGDRGGSGRGSTAATPSPSPSPSPAAAAVISATRRSLPCWTHVAHMIQTVSRVGSANIATTAPMGDDHAQVACDPAASALLSLPSAAAIARLVEGLQRRDRSVAASLNLFRRSEGLPTMTAATPTAASQCTASSTGEQHRPMQAWVAMLKSNPMQFAL